MSLPANFPSSLDSLANPTATTNRDDPGFELDLIVARIHDILEALEAKVGVTASLPAGSQVLRATGSGTTAWQQVQPGDLAPGAGLARIGAVVGPLGANQASIDFAAIPQTYTTLRIVLLARATTAAVADTVTLVVNGVATATYYTETIYGSGATAAGSEQLAATTTGVASVTGATGTVGWPGAAVIDIPGYATTTLTKIAISAGGLFYGVSTGNMQSRLAVGMLNSTAAITSLSLKPAGGSFAPGTICALYGL